MRPTQPRTPSTPPGGQPPRPIAPRCRPSTWAWARAWACACAITWAQASVTALSGLALATSLAHAGAADRSITVRSDTAVVLQTTQVQWQIDGPFAERAVWLTLRNPSAMTVEATLVLPLGEGEQLKGFALDIHGELRDAVPVERVKAKVAFEEVVRTRIDPALVEKDEGPQYRVRVFPVPAGGTRQVRVNVVSLAQRQACGWQHRLGVPFDTEVAATLRSSKSDISGISGISGWQAEKTETGSLLRRTLPAHAEPLSLCVAAPEGALHMSQTLPDGQKLHYVDFPVPQQSTLASTKPPKAIEVVWDNSLNLRPNRSRELSFLEAYLIQALRSGPLKVELSLLSLDVQRDSLMLRDYSDIDRLIDRLAKMPSDGAAALASWQPAAGVGEVLMFSPLRETWPAQRAPASAIPVHLISTEPVDSAKAFAWLKSGGVQIRLSELNNQTALQVLAQRSAISLRLGPTTQNWKAASIQPEGGSLRACHISRNEPAPSELPIWRRGRATDWSLPEPSESVLLAFWCGTWAMADAQSRDAVGEMKALGERFGVTSAHTSLLVLERAQDYIRFGIDPGSWAPQALRDAVAAHRHEAKRQESERQAGHLQRITNLWAQRQAWWRTEFPKADAPVKPMGWGSAPPAASKIVPPVVYSPPAPTLSSPAPAGAPAPAPAPAPQARSAPIAKDASNAASDAPAVLGLMRAVSISEPYTSELLAVREPTQVYQRYLSLRESYAQSPAFYFDVADRLFEVGDAELATRVLSNIVHLMPSEADALRVVAYRLQQAGKNALALDLLRKLIELSPHEPQSFRDYGLALGRSGQCAAAGEQLGHTVATAWPERLAEIGLIALAELNDLQGRCPGAWPARLPESLKASLPVGLRVTLRSNLNDTYIDLHMTDPNQDEAYWKALHSRQGGRMFGTAIYGYGPQEFILKSPHPGRYRVAVNYFGSSRATLVRGAVVQVELQSGFGTGKLRQQSLTLRLLEKTGKVLVGEFEVDAQGAIKPIAQAR